MSRETQTAWICTAMMRIGMRMATGFDQYFEPLGLTQSQFRILLGVRSRGGKAGITPSVLADHLLIERGTVSVLSNRMVEEGWIERHPGENRRSYRLRLTPKGKRILETAVPRASDLADETLSGFSRQQLENMRTVLEHIEARMRATDLNLPHESLDR
jgi:DNA-binding MarR family transcriptional regulator